MQPRRLLVIRHAHADQGGATDAERALTVDGGREAEELGAWLAGQGWRADHALVSSAQRAAETWDGVRRGAGWDLEPELQRALYSAEPDTALDLLRELDDHAAVALVGHNPTVGSLAQLLDDGEGDPAAGVELATSGFPPASVAVFEHDGAWADLAWASARLLSFRAP